MPRPRKAIRPTDLHLLLPEDLVAQIELELYSETLGAVPQGAKSAYFERLARDDLAKRQQARALNAAAAAPQVSDAASDDGAAS